MRSECGIFQLLHFVEPSGWHSYHPVPNAITHIKQGNYTHANRLRASSPDVVSRYMVTLSFGPRTPRGFFLWVAIRRLVR